MPVQEAIRPIDLQQEALQEIGLAQRARLDQLVEPLRAEKTAVPDVFLQAFKEDEKKEIDMGACWGSFSQLVFFNDITRPDGSVVRKGVGISMPYPPGVSLEMRREILHEALGVNEADEQLWKGDGGHIYAVADDRGDGPGMGNSIRRFIKASADVLDKKHPKRKHEKVREFVAMQEERLRFTDKVEWDAELILNTPIFTGWSAFNEEYKGLGKMYVLEFIMEEDGVVKGSAPDGTARPLLELATNESHELWLRDGLVAMMQNRKVKRGGDSDDTLDVSLCGGMEDEEASGCGTFYEIMEGRSQRETVIYSSQPSYKNVFIQPVYALAWNESGRSDYCTKHKKWKRDCDCTSSEVLAQAG